MTSIRLDLLELFGRGYVVEHCVSAFQKEAERLKLHSYIADAVKIIAENTARAAGGGREMRCRYVDMIDVPGAKKDERTGDEIAQEIIKRAGLKAKE